MPFIPPAPDLNNPRLTPEQRERLYRDHRKLLVDGAAHCGRMSAVAALVLLGSLILLGIGLVALFGR